MKNVAVILAGGSGERLKLGYPKQFYKVAGKMIIEHTLDAFQLHEGIDEIAIVCNPAYLAEVENVVMRGQYSKVKKILFGGDERYESSLAAINAYDDAAIGLIFHDAVRPLVSDRVICECIDGLKQYNAIDVVIPATDTIVRVDPSGRFIKDIPVRSALRNGQTPQAFRLGTIREAYRKALQDPDFKTTDDCGVVLKYLPGEPVATVQGDSFNIKLTHREDLFLLDKLFQLRTTSMKSDKLDDEAEEKMKGRVVVVFGGSYGIGKEVANVARRLGAEVFSFSRSENNTDASALDDIKAALAKAHESAGRIDFVVMTAGLLLKEPLSSMNYDDIHRVIDINVFGAFAVAKESFEYLRASRGALLLFTSSSYTRGRAMYSLYSATKAGIVNMVQALNEEWRDFDVRVNCINPERTRTPMRISNFGNEPSDSLLSPETVAIAAINTILSGVSGHVIDVKRKIEGR